MNYSNGDRGFLEDLLSAGVPSATYNLPSEVISALAIIFETSSRQIREWKDQRAIKCTVYSAYMVVRVRSRFGVLIKTKPVEYSYGHQALQIL